MIKLSKGNKLIFKDFKENKKSIFWARYVYPGIKAASNNALIDFITQIFSIPIRKEATDIIRVSAEYISPSPGFSRHLPDIVLQTRGGSEKEPHIHIDIQTEHDGMMNMRMENTGILSEPHGHVRMRMIPG